MAIACLAAGAAGQVSKSTGKRIAPPPTKTPAVKPGEVPAASEPIAAAPGNPGAVEFNEKPIRIEEVGLTLRYPTDADTQVDSAGRDSQVTIFPKDHTWTMIVKTPRSTDKDLTIAQVADVSLQAMFDSYGIGSKTAEEAIASGSLIREPARGATLKVGDFDIERWYLTVPSSKGDEPVVRGYTVLRTAPGQFITFELLTPHIQSARTKAIYQTVVATAKIEAPEKMLAARAAAVEAGLKLFDAVGTTTYREIIAAHPERWERRFKPGPSGEDSDAKEIAYRRVRLSIGPRGKLEADKSASKAMGNKTEGFILEIDVRMLLEGGSTADSRGVYFLSLDKNEESWTLSSAVRAPGKGAPQVGSEIGARTGRSMMVRTEATGDGSKTHKPVMGTEGYISQVEAQLLPYLLMKTGVELEHAFYSWRTGDDRIMLRKDYPQKVDVDGQINWRITTQLAEGRPPQTSFYDEKGELVRTEMSDGSVWEPTTFEKLKELWERKGLPTK